MDSKNIAEMRKGKVLVFSCGGCGTNIGYQLEKHRGSKETGFAQLDIVYLDTSKVNLRKDIAPENCFIIDGLDGSGKVRSENHVEIGVKIKAILQKFKPADLNIVISSASGGSGSVISPLLVRELLKNENPVVVLAVGSTDTLLDSTNTLKTIKSFESVARSSKTPIVMNYVQNSKTTPPSEVDSLMLNTIIEMAVLFSRENRGLDSRDLYNWLQFHRVTSFPAQLASLTTHSFSDNLIKNLDEVGNIISVATIVKEGMPTTLETMLEYQCCGFLPENIQEGVDTRVPMHYVISDGVIPNVAKQLEKHISDLKAAQEARNKPLSIVTANDIVEEDGLVL